MKNIIKLILFIVYVVFIFMIDYKLLILSFIINIILGLIVKIDFMDMCKNIKIFLPFVIFTALINVVLGGLYDGIIMGARMIVSFIITYVFSKSMDILELADAIENILYPLRIFKIDTKNISIIISIAICMIPVIKNEFEVIRYSLISKGCKIKISNISLLAGPLLISIIRRVDEIESTLISRANEQ